MIALEYEPYDATAVPDGRMVHWLERIKIVSDDPTCNVTLQFSTENIFYLVRLAVAQGEIHYKNIVFKFNGQVIPLDKYGQYDDPSPLFLNCTSRLNELILRQVMRIGPE